MDIKIIVATHKRYWMPNDDIYLPIQVGKACNEAIGFQGGDSGDNISYKNPYYCELTGLYWAWKNLDVDYIGLAHYRRHFSANAKGSMYESVLTRTQLEKLIEKTDVILPKRRHYYIETIYSHYAHTFGGSQLDKTRAIIETKYPDYLAAYDKTMKSRSAHLFNMFIMKKELVDKYCQWLFDILFDLEKQIDVSGLTAFEARLFGRVSERLLDVWIRRNQIKYRELKYICMEPVNWQKKINGFLRAKLIGQKYSASW